MAMIEDKETALARRAMEYALARGAAKVRVTLTISEEDLVATLNGQVDRITHCSDRSLSMHLFVDGRFGSFSTNKLEEKALERFIDDSISIVRMLAEDGFRDLPDPSRTCKEAVDGTELGLLDPAYGSIRPEMRRQTALAASVFNSAPPVHAATGGHGLADSPACCSSPASLRSAHPSQPDGWDPPVHVATGGHGPAGDEQQQASVQQAGAAAYTIVSEEGEYSDSIYETVVMDSNGLFCRHCENSFDYGTEVTVEDEDGEKYSGYWWDSSSRADGIDAAECGRRAVRNAAEQIGSEPVRSGKYNMVVASDVASKFVSPLLRALNAYSIQQNDSFLTGSLGKQVFPEGLTINDVPAIKGQTCSKLFDSEGVATMEGPVIEKGRVMEYFVNTYMAGKMGVEPTVEDATRPRLEPWPEAGLDQEAIMKKCGDGILVTEFNGGNSNSATGDFSYGIQGFLFKGGAIVRPVSEMLVTGNLLTLWQGFIAAGSDARSCMSKLIPTLAFSNVDFSG